MSVPAVPYYAKTYKEKTYIHNLAMELYMMGGFECEHILDIRDVAASACTVVFNEYDFELKKEIEKKKLSEVKTYNRSELTNGVVIESEVTSCKIFDLCEVLEFKFTKGEKSYALRYTEDMLENLGKASLEVKMALEVEKALNHIGVFKGDKK